MLKLQKQYPTLSAIQVPVTADIKVTMLEFTSKFHQAFSARYSGMFQLPFHNSNVLAFNNGFGVLFSINIKSHYHYVSLY